MVHIPVLQKEVIQYLSPKPNENFIDCTIGGGGHTRAILEKNGPQGKVMGIDQDQEMIKNIESRFGNEELEKRLILVCDNFVNLGEIVEKRKFGPINGILLDLGISSWHITESKRGFSFLREEPLLMRYDGDTNKLTAEKIINDWPEEEIEKILKEYGQERFAKKITKEIIQQRETRPIKATTQLVEIIRRATPGWYQHRRIHFATKTFQALRIAVNEELNNLERTLPQVVEVLETEGRIVIISFHSLEDRIVKNFFRKESKNGQLKILTKKPIKPTEKEISFNPRSRSAKLRAALKIHETSIK